MTGIISSKKKGDKVQLTVLRQGREKQIEVTLGERPAALPLSPDQPQQP